MELEFLKMIDFSLYISPEELTQCADSLLSFSLMYHPGQTIMNLPRLLDSKYYATKTITEAEKEPREQGQTTNDTTVHEDQASFAEIPQIINAAYQALVIDQSFEQDLFVEPVERDLATLSIPIASVGGEITYTTRARSFTSRIPSKRSAFSFKKRGFGRRQTKRPLSLIRSPCKPCRKCKKRRSCSCNRT